MERKRKRDRGQYERGNIEERHSVEINGETKRRD